MSGYTIKTVEGSSVPLERVSWVWEGWLAHKKLHMLTGSPGLGKSTLVLDIAARVSAGKPFPDGSPCKPGMVWVLAGEDDLGDTVRPKLELAGADMANITFVDRRMGASRPGGKRPAFNLPDAMPELENCLQGVSLLIIDPLTAFMGDVNQNKASEVIGVLLPLLEIIEKTGTAVLLVSHHKKGDGSGVEKVMGSISTPGYARAVYSVCNDPLNYGGCRITTNKSNISRHRSFSYAIADGVHEAECGQFPSTRIVWGDVLEGVTHDDVVMGGRELIEKFKHLEFCQVLRKAADNCVNDVILPSSDLVDALQDKHEQRWANAGNSKALASYLEPLNLKATRKQVNKGDRPRGFLLKDVETALNRTESGFSGQHS